MPGMNGLSEEFGTVLAVAPDLECPWDGSQQFSAPNFLGPRNERFVRLFTRRSRWIDPISNLETLVAPIVYLGICHRRHVFGFRRYKV